ncbi:MAG: SNF2 helicase associated domain-containing protein, partial [Eubacteriales bacterium]
MKNISLTDSQIRKYAGNTAVYLRGHTYYTENRVTDFRFDSDELTAYATVSGTVPYDVEITLSHNGDIRNFWCDCPAFSKYDGSCKHIVAVLIAFQRNLQNTRPISTDANKEAVGEIINLFSGLDKQRKMEEVNLELFLEVVNPSYGLTASVEFKIGLERLYVLKNIKEFLAAISQQKPVEFGKNFVFEPDKHTFKSCDRPVVDFLMEMLALETAMNPFSYYTSNSAFHGKTVKLNDFYLKKFLDILGDRLFSFCFSPGLTVPYTTVRQGLPLSFTVEPAGQGLALIMDSGEMPVAITKSGDYFYYQDSIYRAGEEQKKFFFPLLNKYLHNQSKIVFPAAFVEPFVSEVLPCIRKTGQVNIAPALEKSFCQEELVAKIFFDRILEDSPGQPGIAARFELHYGEQIINPFASAATNDERPAGKKIIVRESPKEHKIFDLLEQTGFTVNQGEIHLYGDERIFNFIENILPDLQQLAEIYYSENFKGLRIRTSASCSGRVRLDENLNLLEFSLQMDDIDDDDLEQVFHALKLRKKYFRLKDGSFLDL